MVIKHAELLKACYQKSFYKLCTNLKFGVEVAGLRQFAATNTRKLFLTPFCRNSCIV